MKRALVILAAAGCNQVYDLDRTRLVDAAPPDAPPACRADLAFSPQLHQVTYQRCNTYTTADTGRALAHCFAGGTQFIGEGPIDGTLVPVPADEPLAGALPLMPRLAPEGDRAIILHTGAGVGVAVSMHRRDDAGWRYAYDLPVVLDYDDTIGTPSRRPNARFLHARPNAGVVDEYVEDAPDAWRRVRSYTAAELATLSLYSAFNLTADGLHVMYQALRVDGTIVILHAWRDSVDAPFGSGVVVPGIPKNLVDVFMTEDCGRVYFSGLASIFYARQL